MQCMTETERHNLLYALLCVWPVSERNDDISVACESRLPHYLACLTP
jgi:hypothetical protein